MTPGPFFYYSKKIVTHHKNICKSIIVVDLHNCFTDTWQLPRTHVGNETVEIHIRFLWLWGFLATSTSFGELTTCLTSYPIPTSDGMSSRLMSSLGLLVEYAWESSLPFLGLRGHLVPEQMSKRVHFSNPQITFANCWQCNNAFPKQNKKGTNQTNRTNEG